MFSLPPCALVMSALRAPKGWLLARWDRRSQETDLAEAMEELNDPADETAAPCRASVADGAATAFGPGASSFRVAASAFEVTASSFRVAAASFRPPATAFEVAAASFGVDEMVSSGSKAVSSGGKDAAMPAKDVSSTWKAVSLRRNGATGWMEGVEAGRLLLQAPDLRTRSASLWREGERTVSGPSRRLAEQPPYLCSRARRSCSNPKSRGHAMG